jgi:putative transcriptional regulator
MLSLLYLAAMSIKNQIRRFRFDAGEMTQQELAAKVGVTRQTILSIERGNYNPSVELALRLARAFGTSVETLFELDETREGRP